MEIKEFHKANCEKMLGIQQIFECFKIIGCQSFVLVNLGYEKI